MSPEREAEVHTEFRARIDAISRRIDSHIAACSGRYVVILMAIAAATGVISTAIVVAGHAR